FITEIGFASADGKYAMVIPFVRYTNEDKNYWATLEEEKEAWEIVKILLDTKPVIGQNFQYDMGFLWRYMGIAPKSFLGDTMLLHHTLYPELKKSLGFLGSLYTNEPAWKFMRKDAKTKTAKKED
ncbi:hypothetical protein D6827_00160, partial [Candidatus Parcubacteria bacterium]